MHNNNNFVLFFFYFFIKEELSSGYPGYLFLSSIVTFYSDVYMLINTLYIEVENPDSSTDSSTDIVLLLDLFYIGPGSCGLFNLEG